MVPRPLLLALAIAGTAARPAAAEEAPRRLLYGSAETTEGSDYAGLGWMQAPRGLDRSGPVYTIEVGRNLLSSNRLGMMAGWRLVGHGIYATGLAGLEMGDVLHPAASLDIWWNRGGWMASARSQIIDDSDDSARLAAGYRAFGERWPWIGPEITFNWQGTRLGLHATGLHLPLGVDARVSAGRFEGGTELRPLGGTYLELSLWRRF